VSGAVGQAQVWVIEGGTLARRAVTLGRRAEALGRVEIVSGLAPDAQVLAARFDGLREGRQATVVERAAAVASSASAAPVR
jgi:membrane fusion protein, multidrug efflux system